MLIRFAQATLAKKRGDYPKSIALLRDILASHAELTPIRVQLAIVLFHDKQVLASKSQFNKALADPNLPKDIAQLIGQYISVLDQRNQWRFNASGYYLEDDNVNNASDAKLIENTPFVKGSSMLPQKATGVSYSLGASKEFGLFNAHSIHFDTSVYGQSYWDNHGFDSITSRVYLGYRNTHARLRWSILPLYEHHWYGGETYKYSDGVRGQFLRSLSPRWQWSMALEYKRNHHKTQTKSDGNSKLISTTLVWQRTPKQYFYTGFDASRESTQLRRFDYDYLATRVGWGQEWGWGISSRLSASVAKRDYQDNFVLGGVIYFSKKREDDIYSASATLWKRDWHFWGLTPKLNVKWRKQKSNFSSLYAYDETQANILIEKSF